MRDTLPRRPRRVLAGIALPALAAAALAGAAAPAPASAACIATVTYQGAPYVGTALADPAVVGRRVGPGTQPGCNDVITIPPGPPEPSTTVALHRVRGVAPRFAVAAPGRHGPLYVAAGERCLTAGTIATLVPCLQARTRRYVAGPSLIAPPSAPAGAVIPIAVHVQDPIRQRAAAYGLEALLQAKVDGRWASVFHLVAAIGGGDPPVPVAVGDPGFAVPAIGVLGGRPQPVRLPQVAPGVYRLAKRVTVGGRGRWLVSDLTILAP